MAGNNQTQESLSANQSASDTTSTGSEPKKSWYRRYHDAKTGRDVQIDEKELKKYTGMSKAQLDQWSKDRPGVGGNQAAGKLTVGPATGLGGYEVANGYGGWGPSAADDQLKYPPQKTAEHRKEVDGENTD
jgi:hypothetical protein